MDPRIDTVTQSWRFRSCDSGYAGLNALSDGNFSGSVSAAGATGYMVNGRLVGIAGGTIESFASSDVAAMEADDAAEALLCAMLIADSTVEGEYYTGDTAIDDVHQTLSSGGFSGYLELSENVFSGDYFVMYYGGTSKSVALLGAEERVISGDEAFERACDEVGIYEVRSVTLRVIDIPEPEETESVEARTPETSEPKASEEPESDPEPVTDPTPTSGTVEAQSAPPSANTATEASPPGEQDLASLAKAARGGSAASVATSKQAAFASDGVTDEWLSIPALDPSETSPPHPNVEATHEEPADEGATDAEVPSPEPTPEEVAQQERELAEMATELDASKEENDRLRERIAELEERLEEAIGGTGTDALSAEKALEGTNLFVRYETKGSDTLVDAATGGGDRDAIQRNIRLEKHTQFETDGTTVDGDSFETFLRDSLEYRFVEWILTELLFELRDSGREKGFDGLVDAIPEVDRIEFRGTVPIHTDENGERNSEEFSFDVVFRSSMGAALLAANVHDDRAPVGQELVADLLADANSVGTAKPSLKGALFVARSFFEPEALETVADATSGGLLRGSSRESYVSVTRKHGFHLCLVEARDGSFHLNVPES